MTCCEISRFANNATLVACTFSYAKKENIYYVAIIRCNFQFFEFMH